MSGNFKQASSKMVNPEIPSLRSRLFYFFYRRFGSPFKEGASLIQQRSSVDRQSRFILMPRRVKVEPVRIGELYAEWLLPSGIAKDDVILYLHGGGYTMGSCKSHRALASRIATSSHCSALCIAYRLAPEHPFPAGLEDAKTAYRWLIDEGFSHSHVVFAGDSAGGGLALATAIALREEGYPLPAAIVCMSPWLDLTMSGYTVVECALTDPLINLETSRMHAGLYAGTHDLREPLLSPLFANLRGLPPIILQVGEYEILRSDSERFAENARQAGVEVKLGIWKGMWHVWHVLAGYMPESQDAIDRLGSYIQETLGSGNP